MIKLRNLTRAQLLYISALLAAMAYDLFTDKSNMEIYGYAAVWMLVILTGHVIFKEEKL